MKKIKRYTVDLNDSLEMRWMNVLEDSWYMKSLKQMSEKFLENVNFSKSLQSMFIKIISTIMNNGAYPREMKCFNKYFPDYQVMAWNITYEINQLVVGIGKLAKLEWCTSGAKYLPEIGMIHLRNNDWPMPILKKTTIVVDFINGPSGPFSAVTFPGYLGVLSGVARGRFSATINMAATDNRINLFGRPASFIVRDMFEGCSNFDEALEFLKNGYASAPAMVHLVGLNKGESIIMNYSSKGRFFLESNVSANHYQYDENYTDETSEMDSEERMECMQKKLSRIKTPKGGLISLGSGVINNEDTIQSMVLIPKTGEILM